MYELIQPMLAELLTTIIIALLGYVTVLIQKWMLDSRRVKQLSAAMQIAYGIWVELEEQMPALVGEEKMARMKEILHIDFPLLSDAQLTAINKEIHNRMRALYNRVTEE